MIGMLRCKNESRWIEKAIRSLSICERVYLMDDHSEDDTAKIAESLGAKVFASPFKGLDEARDKTWLYQRIWRECKPQWVICLDGDEELLDGDALLTACQGRATSFSLRVLYLWDENHVRTDGIYGRFRRPSVFRGGPNLSFMRTVNGGNFHCSSVPVERLRNSIPLDVRLLHYGYMNRTDRLRKWRWYNEHDPGNHQENEYLHCIQGDVPEVPASARLKWAGPLRLERV